MAELPRHLFQAIVARLEETQPGGYAHLANVGSIDSEGEFKLAEGLVIRRATSEEAAEIRSAIEFYYPDRHCNPYEMTAVDSVPVAPVTRSYHWEMLPEEGWRYIVVGFLGSNVRLHAFLEASCMTPWPLELGFTADNCQLTGFGRGTGLKRAVEKWDRTDHLLELSRDMLEELGEVFARFANYDHLMMDLRKPLRQFEEIADLAQRSALRFLGLFAIVESIITHAPKATDPYDSITRQVKKKLGLLNKRFVHALPYEEFFKSTSAEKVWEKLYTLRSKVAHGADFDFASGDLAILRDLEHATAFLRLSASAVLRAALEEPQLVADLREC